MASLTNGTKVSINNGTYIDKNGKNITSEDIKDIVWTISNTISDGGREYYILINKDNDRTFTVRTRNVTAYIEYTEPNPDTLKLYKNKDINSGYVDYVKLKSSVTTNVNGATIGNEYKSWVWGIKSILNDEVTLVNGTTYLTVKTSEVSETSKPMTEEEAIRDTVATSYNNIGKKNSYLRKGDVITNITCYAETDGTPISAHSAGINWTVSSINSDGSYLLTNDENNNTMTVSFISSSQYTFVKQSKEQDDIDNSKKDKLESLFTKESNIEVGDIIMTDTLKDYNGQSLSDTVRSNAFKVVQVGGDGLPSDRVVIADMDNNIIAAVKAKDLKALDVENLNSFDKMYISALGVQNNANKLLNLFNNLNTEDEWYEHDPGFKDRDPSTILDALSYKSINGSAVQVLGDKLPATENQEPDILENNDISVGDNVFGYDTEYASISDQLTNDVDSLVLKDDFSSKVARDDPEIIQNDYNFPKVKDFDVTLGRYKYDYSMNYNDDGMLSNMDNIRKSMNIDVITRSDLSKKYTNYYNRFKLENANDHLRKSFAHVFFIRPDLNIFNGSDIATDVQLPELQPGLKSEPEWYYASKHTPEILRQLTQLQAGYDHQFMMLLSNKALSFELSDEFIGYEAYGKTLTGYQIVYGKSNIESKTNQQFSINYRDNNLLHIYNTHKLWTNYISDVFRGKYYPKTEYIYNKIIDYATCVYYFLCGEDGETILFWSKYWGVFPNNAPSSPFSYQSSNPGGVHHPELNITYNYSFKEDFNPFSIIEFNNHANTGNLNYVRPYNKDSLSTGYTWVGAPFIETFAGDASLELPYTFKLRFRPNPELNYNPTNIGSVSNIGVEDLD